MLNLSHPTQSQRLAILLFLELPGGVDSCNIHLPGRSESGCTSGAPNGPLMRVRPLNWVTVGMMSMPCKNRHRQMQAGGKLYLAQIGWRSGWQGNKKGTDVNWVMVGMMSIPCKNRHSTRN